jgi:hypothetical protein
MAYSSFLKASQFASGMHRAAAAARTELERIGSSRKIVTEWKTTLTFPSLASRSIVGSTRACMSLQTGQSKSSYRSSTGAWLPLSASTMDPSGWRVSRTSPGEDRPGPENVTTASTASAAQATPMATILFIIPPRPLPDYRRDLTGPGNTRRYPGICAQSPSLRRM